MLMTRVIAEGPLMGTILIEAALGKSVVQCSWYYFVCGMTINPSTLIIHRTCHIHLYIGVYLAVGGACVLANNIRVLSLYRYQSYLVQYGNQAPPAIIKEMERSRRFISLRATCTLWIVIVMPFVIPPIVRIITTSNSVRMTSHTRSLI